MGHIELAAPVSHIWYFKGIPSRMGLVLDMSPRSLEEVIYFASYVVTKGGDTPLTEKQLISEREYRELKAEYGNALKPAWELRLFKPCYLKLTWKKKLLN